MKRTSKFIASLMCLMIAVAFMPNIAFATDGATSQAAPINVKLTVNDQGVIAKDKDGKPMAYRDLTVTDIDKDGVISFDEALVAAHNEYYGTNGYSLENGAYGLYVAKLWGVETSNTLFINNNQAITSGVDSTKVEDGDYLYASINKDNTNYADWYTYFNKKDNTVFVNEDFTLNLKGYQGMSGGTATNLNGIEIGTLKDGVFNAISNTVTDENGNVTLSFDAEGEYIVTARGAVNDTWNDWQGNQITADCPIMAPACIVTVKAKPINVKLTINDRGELASDKDGKPMAYRDVTATDIDEDGVITFDEALVAAHDKYVNGGAAGGYEISSSGWVEKLWGKTSDASYSFTCNDKIAVDENGQGSTVDAWAIKEGDALYASINKDDKYYADWYTYFDKKTITVDAKETFTVNLKGGKAMDMSFDAAVKGVELGYLENGSFKKLETTTGNDGSATVTINRGGTYYLTAKGTVKDTVTDWYAGVSLEADCPIMAPVCVVTVNDTVSSLKDQVADQEQTIANQQNTISALKIAVAELKAAAIKPAPKATAVNTKSIKVSWTKGQPEDVDGYEISNDGGKTWTEETASSKAFTGLKPATKYSYKVRGYVYVDGEGTDKYYSEAYTTSATTPLSTAAITSVKSKSRKLTTKWNKVEGATSYQVYIGTNKSVSKGLVKYTTKSLSKTSKKLKKNKTYYVKVRAYSNGVYGPWSTAKKVKCK